MRTMKHLAIAAMTATALALAGCGGGGSSPQSATDGATQVEQIATLQGQINALRAELGLPAIDIDDLTGSVTALENQVRDLTKQVSDAKDKADKDATIAMTAKGKAIFKVLDTFGATGITADSTRPTAEIAPVATPPGVTATYGAATKLTPANLNTFVNGLSAFDADTAYTSAQAGDPASLAANNGFSGTMLTWSNSGKADTMTVYTDIAASASRLFSEVHGGGTQVLDPGDTAHTGVTGTAFEGRTAGQVTHAPNAKVTTASTTNDLVRLSGMYKGATGSYTCTPGSGACATRISATGVTFVDSGATTGWMFTANDGAMVSVADSSYMTFGWWMRDDKTSADILDHVAVFYQAPHDDALAITSLTGKADYMGGAAGKYAWRDRVADTAHGGHFTAKAMLTADFGAADALGTLNGKIFDFRIGDDGMDPNWTVTLSPAAFNDGGAVARVAADADPNVTWAVGSSKANAAGSWEAQLSDSGASRNDDLPTGVAGAFNAEFNEQGRMLGAFGANITNPNPPKN